MTKVAIISSTNGSVATAALRLPYLRSRIATVVSDRPCGAIRSAEAHGIASRVFPAEDSLAFSNHLDDFFAQTPHHLLLSFYTKLFRGRFVDRWRGRLLNFHPSILPACPGMDGFGDTVRAGSRFIGATVHLVDHGMDTGFPLLQCALPFDPNLDLRQNRHAVFVAQCKMLIQIVKWYEDGRITHENDAPPQLIGGTYGIDGFSPNLDFPLAQEFEVPAPAAPEIPAPGQTGKAS